MRIRVHPDLSELAVFAEGREQTQILGASGEHNAPLLVTSFRDPLLLTDNARIAELDPGLRDAVFQLYQAFPRTVEYDGCEVSWSPDRYPRVWCPSIDTVFFARGIRSSRIGRRSVCEIGTGSGFLLKYMLLGCPDTIERAVATDINRDAIACADDATRELACASRIEFVRTTPDAPTLGAHGPFDLLVTNPPYIVRPGMRNDNPYEGLDLIRKLASEAHELLAPDGELWINLSTLSGDQPRAWLEREGGLVMELVDELRVPLKVNNITSGLTSESRSWLQYLVEQGLVELDESSSPHYRYWHTLRLYRCLRSM
jgi:hypothetical protein